LFWHSNGPDRSPVCLGLMAWNRRASVPLPRIIEEADPQIFLMRISDQGPGIEDLSAIMEGQYPSKTERGLGIISAKRLMDRFRMESVPGRGTTVLLGKPIPQKTTPGTRYDPAQIAIELVEQAIQDPIELIRQQNRELVRTLEALGERQEELERVNQELEDTNRGVKALYAELEEKANHLRLADELKSRFLSNMSHEFRTPINSITALSQILLDRTDGELTGEQDKQVNFIGKAAKDLSELVNDLLDLAKIEAGKVVVRPDQFAISNLFSALRGMMKPLVVNPSVALVFEGPTDVPMIFTDEGKISQILSNFISNALKFTEQGEIRVSAGLDEGGTSVVFSVADTGMGIAAEDQERIFQKFSQMEGPIQKKVKGTGLGLPLSRKLAELLGGSVTVRSQPGTGSTFLAIIPRGRWRRF